MHLDIPRSEFVEQVGGRLDCVVASIRRPPKSPRSPQERTGDDPVHVVRRPEHLAGAVAPFIELLEGHDLLVRRDLEDRVGRRIEDGTPALHVRCAELLDDLGPGGRHISERQLAGYPRKSLDDLRRKAVGVGREGDLGDDAHHLPMAGYRILAAAAFAQAGDAGAAGFATAATPGISAEQSKPEAFEIRQRQRAQTTRDVADRVGPGCVAVRIGVGKCADASRINDDRHHAHKLRRFSSRRKTRLPATCG